MRWILTTLLVATGSVALGDETRWGDLSGRFVFEGKPPERKVIPVDRDVEQLGPSVEDESLLIHEANSGIANIVLYLAPRNPVDIPVHPDYEATADAKVELKMKDGRFQPHVLLLRTTQKMVQTNGDSIAHNANISFLKNVPM